MSAKERELNTILLILLPPGLLALGWSVANFPLEKLSLELVALAVTAVFVSSYLQIDLPRTRLHLTVSDAFIFLTLLMYGGSVAIILAMVEAAFSTFRLFSSRRRTLRLYRTLTINALIAGFSTFVTAKLVAALFGADLAGILTGEIAPLAILLGAMAVSQFTVNTFLVAAYVATNSGRGVFQAWSESCFNALIIFCIGAILAGFSAKAILQTDMALFVSAIGFFALVYITYKRYADDVTNASSKAELSEIARMEDAERHLSELRHYVDELTRTTEELSRSRESFRYSAYHDFLTGLPNRRSIVETTQALLDDTDEQFALMLLKLDRFRTINESLGYRTGDRVIMHLAERLSGVIRPADTLGHLGGDKFILICRELSGPEEATEIAAKAAKCVAEAIIFRGRQLYVRANVGVVFRDDTHKRAEEMIRDSDLSMHAAKVARKPWAVYERSMRADAVIRQQMESDLRYAIVCNELEVFYQPIVDLRTLDLHGFEALVRWNHPRNGLVMPNDFIPLSEDTGLVIPMTLTILREACTRLVEWQASHTTNNKLTVSVNLSGKHLSEPLLTGQIERILADTAIDPGCLKLEITESATMEDTENAIELLEEIRKLGVRINIDDFGTGYSSLGYLRRFPVDTLKIDRSFVKGMEEAEEDDEIVRTILTLGKALNLEIVAEGIENVIQLNKLRELGCQYGQGYLFSPPRPASGIEEILADPKLWHSLAEGFAHLPDNLEPDIPATRLSS
ncbi:MAG TPA: bifunctional diguanylate cyclase/phosphodiesterase [Pyrinomonadaceae bacterium]|nr:bifunctional diguanylate cyclase/phosphodiesterase [Pyrinomonadaceae bacterium]HMP66232.1 bifunctional diguanylate cyclase/phosphodiesterase [Pyrinomonadaceae bacterium]